MIEIEQELKCIIVLELTKSEYHSLKEWYEQRQVTPPPPRVMVKLMEQALGQQLRQDV